MKLILALVLMSASLSSAIAASDQELAWARSMIQEGKKAGVFRPQNGYVPDEATAIDIALSVWTPIYGKEHIENQKPYSAILVDGYWVVSGSLPKLMRGGVAHAVIEKNTGQIIYVIHSQ